MFRHISPIAYAVTLICCLSANAVFACSCFWPSIEQDFAGSDYVVMATVNPKGVTQVERKTISGDDGEEYFVYQQEKISLTIDRIWKGDSVRELIIHTNAGGGSCGYTMEENTTYILFARYVEELARSKDRKTLNVGRSLRTSWCNANIKVKEDRHTIKFIEKVTRIQETQNERKETLKYTSALKDRIKELRNIP